MSTKSRARALRRHPEATEVADKDALAAVGTTILAVATLGLLDPETTLDGVASEASPDHSAPLSSAAE